MSGTRHSARVEDIRKIFARKGWDKDFRIKGSEPYDKGCEVYNMNLGGIPFMTQRFENNNDLFLVIVQNPEEYHPGGQWPRPPIQFDDLKDGQIQPHSITMKATVRKLKELYQSFKSMTDILPIDLNERYIETQIQKYENKLK
jgi:hypothetical protein